MRDIFEGRSWLGRVRVTPVTVIATVAVILAAGGGAYAATSGPGQRSHFNGPASGPTSGPFMTTAGKGFVAGAAVVNSNGSLARGLNVTSSTEVVPGGYQVLFNRKVNRCAYEATLGAPGAGVIPTGQIGVATRHGHKNGVAVLTTDSFGSATPISFHLVVIC